MAPLTPDQVRTRERVETVIRIAAPALNLVLAVGDRVSKLVEPEDLRLRTWVNGDLRQDARTSDLIFGVDALLEFLGQTQALEPGDLILTGTPSGVGYALDPPRFLGDGDVVRIEIERLGSIEHPVAAVER